MVDIRLAAPQRYEALTIFPLVAERKRELPYQLLADALTAGTVELTEVSAGPRPDGDEMDLESPAMGGARVPELEVENRGDQPVLILDGEQLLGAMQNRVVNRSIVLAAHSRTRIPVSCMEQGRWQSRSRTFQHHVYHSPPKMRRHARKLEHAYAAAEMAPAPERLAEAQGEVWEEIANYARTLDSRSPTGAFDEVYRRRAGDLADWSAAFPWVDDQVGLLGFAGGRPLGMDVIGSQLLYARLHKRFIAGFVLDGLAAGSAGGAGEVDGAAAEAFLARVRGAPRKPAPTLGEGVYYVLLGEVMGGELRDESGLVHLSAFPV